MKIMNENISEGKERNKEIALAFAGLVKDARSWEFPFACMGTYETQNGQQIKCTLEQNIKRDKYLRPLSREDIYKITVQDRSNEGLSALEPLRQALEEKGFSVTLEEKTDYLTGLPKSKDKTDPLAGIRTETDPAKLQEEQSNETFDQADQVSHESYKKQVETSGAMVVFPDFLEELEIRQDKRFWYFKHTKCGSIIKVFADVMPSQIARIVNAHFPCDGSPK